MTERLTEPEIRTRALQFSSEWSDPGMEISEAQTFWTDLFAVFGVSRRRVASLEARIGTGRADLFWPGVLLAEAKSPGHCLDKAMTQAIGYVTDLSDDGSVPRWVLTTDLVRIKIRDLESSGPDVELLVADLATRLDDLEFLRSGRDTSMSAVEPEVTRRAATEMAGLYRDIVARGYPEDSAQVLVCRLAYLCYAEDSGVLDRHSFRDMVLATRVDGSDLGSELVMLFQWLGTPTQNRMSGAPDRLAQFVHVPVMFDETIPVPMLGPSTRELLIRTSKLDWVHVDPAILGTLFEAVMTTDNRRATGSHYTAERDVRRVIGPTLFDALDAELAGCCTSRVAVERFQAKLARIRILDPACGSGNFLSVSIRELVRLDIAAAKVTGRTGAVGPQCLVGIELQPFATRIAGLCIEIAWHQAATQRVSVGGPWPEAFAEKPVLFTGCAIGTPWSDVIGYSDVTAIVGNPPYLGSVNWSAATRSALKALYKPLKVKSTGSLDLCAAWLVFASRAIAANPAIRVGFVTTNSLTQGVQVAPLWDSMRTQCPEIRIDWARTSASWGGDASVHVVMIGLGADRATESKLWIGDDDAYTTHGTIGPYLIPGVNTIVRARQKPWSDDTPVMVIGSQPNDGGNLILSQDERDDLLSSHPEVSDLVRPFVGARELLNDVSRYCLWLADVDHDRWLNVPEIRRRVDAVRAHRLRSRSMTTSVGASKPHEFLIWREPNELIYPKVTSGSRRYIPSDRLETPFATSDKVFTTPWSFNTMVILSSSTYMEWMKLTSGRLKGDYSYCNSMTYNTLPIPCMDALRPDLIRVGSHLMDVRAELRSSNGYSLADMYKPGLEHPSILEAHRGIDAVVDELYEIPRGGSRLGRLLELYAALVTPV